MMRDFHRSDIGKCRHRRRCDLGPACPAVTGYMNAAIIGSPPDFTLAMLAFHNRRQACIGLGTGAVAGQRAAGIIQLADVIMAQIR